MEQTSLGAPICHLFSQHKCGRERYTFFISITLISITGVKFWFENNGSIVIEQQKFKHLEDKVRKMFYVEPIHDNMRPDALFTDLNELRQIFKIGGVFYAIPGGDLIHFSQKREILIYNNFQFLQHLTYHSRVLKEISMAR